MEPLVAPEEERGRFRPTPPPEPPPPPSSGRTAGAPPLPVVCGVPAPTPPLVLVLEELLMLLLNEEDAARPREVIYFPHSDQRPTRSPVYWPALTVDLLAFLLALLVASQPESTAGVTYMCSGTPANLLKQKEH